MIKKRGLSRGLEALLKVNSEKSEISKPVIDVEEAKCSPDRQSSDQQLYRQLSAEDLEGERRPEQLLALFEQLRNENLRLLQEAETLKGLLEEFESMVRRL